MSKDSISQPAHSVKGKIIIASIVACGALYLAWATSKIVFKEMLTTVENISEPAERLRLVNGLSVKIVSIEQLQKSQTLNEDFNHQELTNELKELSLIIDTLSMLYQHDSLQLNRIASLKVLLRKRDQLFADYMKERQGFLSGKSMSKQLKTLNQELKENIRKTDSAIIESERRTFTTTIYDSELKKASEKEPAKGFFGRLFGRKKNDEPEKVLNIVNEELNIKVDTLVLARQDSMLKKLGKTMHSIEATQKIKSERFLNREALLVYGSDLLLGRMLSILRQVEKEAVKDIEQRNSEAKSVVNNGINRITVIILIFVVITILLLWLILNDISKINRYRKQLEDAKEEAEYHGRAKQRFLSSMSHEIRTPLQSIIGYSEIIKNQDNPDDKAVDAIFHSSKHLMQIVNEVLDYNRIVSGKFTFTPVVFEMEKLLDEVISVMKLQAANKGIKLYSDYEFEDISFVEGDAFRLKQILYNLLSNAIKFTIKGHVALNVSCQKQQERLIFTFLVEDTGIGLSATDIQKIFNEFEQVENEEKQTLNEYGSGLGLSITRLLVEGQGGKINVKSVLGEGSSFTVYLDYKEINYKTNLSEQQTDNKNTISGKVWMVDDDVAIADLCAYIFTKNNIPYTCFYSPEELLKTTWDDDVKYILTDIRMPGMSGTELCERLKKKVSKELKIYALTAQVLPEEKNKILESGFDGILLKPFTERELLDVLNCPLEREEPDFSTLKKMTFGDDEQLQKLLKQFVTDTKNDKANLEKTLKDEDLQTASLIVHRLAGRTAQFGIKELSADFRKMELELNHLEVFESSVKEKLMQLCQELETFIAKINHKIN